MCAAYLATQRNVHWHGQCMHALVSCHACIAAAYTKLASSAARTANYGTAHHPHTMCAPAVPYTGDLCYFTHGSPLERLRTRYSGSGDCKSSLYTSCSAEHEQYVAADVSLRVVARSWCGERRLAMATMH